MSSSTTCCTVDPNTISSSDRASWCSANRATCATLCASETSDNSCDTATLDYTCKCSAGVEPDLSNYANTVPSLMCNQWQSDCIAANPGDASAQQQCRATQCGSDQASAAIGSSSASSAATSTSARPSAISLSTTPLSPSTESRLSTRRSDTTSTTERSRTRTTSTSSSGSEASGGGQSNNSTGTGTGNSPPRDGGLGTGAKAGIAVGVVLGVLIIALVFFLLRRRSKKKRLPASEPREPYKPSDEKQVVVPVSSEISQKPELHDGSTVGYTPELHSEPVVAYTSSHASPYPSSNYWQRQQQNPAELYSSNGQPNELHGAAYASPVELHSSPRNHHAEPVTEVNTSAQTTRESPPPDPAPPPSQPEPTFATRQELSAEEIEALEEEERRIDAEMAEAQRMKELREQKFAIQQKLRDAQRR